MTSAATIPTTWKPRHDQIVVRPFEAPSRSAGGLHLPEQNRDRPQQGLIIATGPLVERGTDQALAPGDVVAYGKFAGIPFDDPLTGMQLLVMRELEAILTRPNGTVEIVEHSTTNGRTVIHEAGQSCEHCPTPELDKLREEFRAGKARELELEERLMQAPEEF